MLRRNETLHYHACVFAGFTFLTVQIYILADHFDTFVVFKKMYFHVVLKSLRFISVQYENQISLSNNSHSFKQYMWKLNGLIIVNKLFTDAS